MSFYQKVLALLLLVYVGSVKLDAQVWPGDVNNNGVVNAIDWLYLGSIVQEFGPPRSFDQIGIEWEEKTVTTPWGINFPGTTLDYSFADCNGDGFIDFEDFDAITVNYQLEHGVVEEDEPVMGDAGTDPQLFFDVSGIIDPFPQGFIFGLNVNLGTFDMPVEALNGISFSVNVDPNVINTVAFMPADPIDTPWDLHGIFFQQYDPVTGRLDVALTTGNEGPIQNGFGVLGEFFIVIEDDVVGMQDEIITEFELADIFLVGAEDFSPLPIIGDTTNLTIVTNPLSNENLLNPQDFEIFPNPVLEELFIKSDYEIDRVEIFNTIGQRQVDQLFEENYNAIKQLDVTHLNPGIYFIKIHTNKGIATRKVLHR